MRRGAEHFLVPIKSVDELDQPISAAIRDVQPVSSIQRMVSIPPQEYPIFTSSWLRILPFGWRKTPKRILVFGAEQITLIEEEDSLNTIVIPYAALCDLHLCSVLLYAYSILDWVQDGAVETLKIEYNLVGQPYIRQGLEYVRSQMLPASRSDEGEIPAEILSPLPLKFRNFLRSNVLPGEIPTTVIFQPAIRRLYSSIGPNRAAAVTPYHLMFIDEDLSGACRDYAANIRFYPLSRIQSVSIREGNEFSWLNLCVGIENAVHEVAMPMSQPNAETLYAALQ